MWLFTNIPGSQFIIHMVFVLTLHVCCTHHIFITAHCHQVSTEYLIIFITQYKNIPQMRHCCTLSLSASPILKVILFNSFSLLDKQILINIWSMKLYELTQLS